MSCADRGPGWGGAVGAFAGATVSGAMLLLLLWCCRRKVAVGLGGGRTDTVRVNIFRVIMQSIIFFLYWGRGREEREGMWSGEGSIARHWRLGWWWIFSLEIIGVTKNSRSLRLYACRTLDPYGAHCLVRFATATITFIIYALL